MLADAPTGTVTQTASSSLTGHIGGTVRTYLPTTDSVLGCQIISGGAPPPYLAGCEVFSAATEAWTPTGQLTLRNRTRFGMITLNNGDALVVGGFGFINRGFQFLAETERYSPSTGTWTVVGPLARAREDLQLARLPGKQVVTSGGTGGGASTEVLDPLTNSWATGSPMSTARVFHQLVSLEDGRVLAVGGANGTSFYNPAQPFTPGSDRILGSCEVFDPVTWSWAPTGSLATGRYLHRATLLASGKVLATGGLANVTAPGSTQVTAPLASSEICDPASGTWSPGPDMPAPKAGHEQVTLPSGQVFVTSNQDGTEPSSLLFNEAAAAWSPTGSLVLPDLNRYGVLFRG